MNTVAIHQAMRLEKHPEEMAWLCFPDSDFPEGMNDLLRLCASQQQLLEFAKTNNFDSEKLTSGLFNFIEKIMLSEENSDEKILGLNKFSTSQTQKFHYQLLMKIYHPDLSKRSNAKDNSVLITNAYQRLKAKANDQEIVYFSEHRKPTNKHYQASKKSEVQISNTKTAIAIISTIMIFSLVSMVGKFYGTSNSEIVTNNSQINNAVQEVAPNTKQLKKVSTLQPNITLTPEQAPIKATSASLQALLKNLEDAYEKGDVDTIKPILANAPEIKNQTEKQLNDKLETIFEITSERKMVLFDFNWSSVSGILEGKGKFISRYQLVGETTWLTREGNALVSAQRINNKLKITQLTLENQTID